MASAYRSSRWLAGPFSGKNAFTVLLWWTALLALTLHCTRDKQLAAHTLEDELNEDDLTYAETMDRLLNHSVQEVLPTYDEPGQLAFGSESSEGDAPTPHEEAYWIAMKAQNQIAIDAEVGGGECYAMIQSYRSMDEPLDFSCAEDIEQFNKQVWEPHMLKPLPALTPRYLAPMVAKGHDARRQLYETLRRDAYRYDFQHVIGSLAIIEGDTDPSLLVFHVLLQLWEELIVYAKNRLSIQPWADYMRSRLAYLFDARYYEPLHRIHRFIGQREGPWPEVHDKLTSLTWANGAPLHPIFAPDRLSRLVLSDYPMPEFVTGSIAKARINYVQEKLGGAEFDLAFIPEDQMQMVLALVHYRYSQWKAYTSQTLELQMEFHLLMIVPHVMALMQAHDWVLIKARLQAIALDTSARIFDRVKRDEELALPILPIIKRVREVLSGKLAMVETTLKPKAKELLVNPAKLPSITAPYFDAFHGRLDWQQRAQVDRFMPHPIRDRAENVLEVIRAALGVVQQFSAMKDATPAIRLGFLEQLQMMPHQLSARRKSARQLLWIAYFRYVAEYHMLGLFHYSVVTQLYPSAMTQSAIYYHDRLNELITETVFIEEEGVSKKNVGALQRCFSDFATIAVHVMGQVSQDWVAFTSYFPSDSLEKLAASLRLKLLPSLRISYDPAVARLPFSSEEQSELLQDTTPSVYTYTASEYGTIKVEDERPSLPTMHIRYAGPSGLGRFGGIFQNAELKEDALDLTMLEPYLKPLREVFWPAIMGETFKPLTWHFVVATTAEIDLSPNSILMTAVSTYYAFAGIPLSHFEMHELRTGLRLFFAVIALYEKLLMDAVHQNAVLELFDDLRLALNALMTDFLQKEILAPLAWRMRGNVPFWDSYVMDIDGLIQRQGKAALHPFFTSRRLAILESHYVIALPDSKMGQKLVDEGVTFAEVFTPEALDGVPEEQLRLFQILVRHRYLQLEITAMGSLACPIEDALFRLAPLVTYVADIHNAMLLKHRIRAQFVNVQRVNTNWALRRHSSSAVFETVLQTVDTILAPLRDQVKAVIIPNLSKSERSALDRLLANARYVEVVYTTSATPVEEAREALLCAAPRPLFLGVRYFTYMLMTSDLLFDALGAKEPAQNIIVHRMIRDLQGGFRDSQDLTTPILGAFQAKFRTDFIWQSSYGIFMRKDLPALLKDQARLHEVLYKIMYPDCNRATSSLGDLKKLDINLPSIFRQMNVFCIRVPQKDGLYDKVLQQMAPQRTRAADRTAHLAKSAERELLEDEEREKHIAVQKAEIVALRNMLAELALTERRVKRSYAGSHDDAMSTASQPQRPVEAVTPAPPQLPHSYDGWIADVAEAMKGMTLAEKRAWVETAPEDTPEDAKDEDWYLDSDVEDSRSEAEEEGSSSQADADGTNEVRSLDDTRASSVSIGPGPASDPGLVRKAFNKEKEEKILPEKEEREVIVGSSTSAKQSACLAQGLGDTSCTASREKRGLVPRKRSLFETAAAREDRLFVPAPTKAKAKSMLSAIAAPFTLPPLTARALAQLDQANAEIRTANEEEEDDLSTIIVCTFDPEDPDRIEYKRRVGLGLA